MWLYRRVRISLSNNVGKYQQLLVRGLSRSRHGHIGYLDSVGSSTVPQAKETSNARRSWLWRPASNLPHAYDDGVHEWKQPVIFVDHQHPI